MRVCLRRRSSAVGVARMSDATCGSSLQGDRHVSGGPGIASLTRATNPQATSQAVACCASGGSVHYRRMTGSLQKHNSSFSPKVASAMPNHCAAWVSVEANASQTHVRAPPPSPLKFRCCRLGCSAISKPVGQSRTFRLQPGRVNPPGFFCGSMLSVALILQARRARTKSLTIIESVDAIVEA